MAPRRIGIVGYEGVNALDLTGPSEVFMSSLAVGEDALPAYEVIYLGLDGRPFRTGSGLEISGCCAIAEAPALDTIVISGGAGIRDPQVLEPLAHWLRARAPTTRRLVSVCTGLFALAASGLMDGRRATTHWKYAAEIAARFPAIQLDPDAIFVREDRFATSAGVTAGIDLALALVEEDLGPSAALNVARMLVVYVKRPGGQRQYSEPLRFQARASGRLADLAAWIHANLTCDLSAETLAARVNWSPRHFARRFKEAFETTPAEFVEALRISEAAQRLIEFRSSLNTIGASVGYDNADVFRRAFERRYGVPPGLYRARFSSAAAA